MIFTPLGQSHVFSLAAEMGSYTLSYTPPWSASSFRFQLGEDGTVQQKKLSGSKNYVRYESGPNYSAVRTKRMTLLESQTDGYLHQMIENPSENLRISSNISTSQRSIEVTQSIMKDEKSLSAVQYSCVQHPQEYKVECLINLNKERDNFTRIFSRQNNEVKNFRGFEIVHGIQSIALINSYKDVDMKYEMDGAKKVTKTEVKIRRKTVYTSGMEYDGRGRLVRLSEKILSSTRVTEYSYTKSSRIETVKTPNIIWTYEYDKNGNFINVDFGIGNTSFVYEAGERVSVGGFNQVTYSPEGNLLSRSGYQFVYNDLGQLTSILYKGGMRKEIYYDLHGRPILIMDNATGYSMSMVNGVQASPWLVTHYHLSRSSTLFSLTYDSQDNLIAVEDKEDILIVVTDSMGTPHTVFDRKGDIVKEVTMSPFGTVLEDTNEDLITCVGFHGGIDLQETGIVIIKGRPYDSVLGTWMIPSMENMVSFAEFTDVTEIHAYRFNKNDPINRNTRNYLNTLSDWLKFFNFDLEKMSNPLLDPSKMKSLKSKQIKSSHKQKMNVLNPKIQKSLTLEEERRSVSIARSFHMLEPIFPNIILTKHSDLITAHAVEGATMVEKMMADILNRTVALDNYGDDDNDIYFVKKEGFIEEEMTALKKYVDISERNIPPFGKEICIQAAKTKLCGLSGIESIEHQYVVGLGAMETARVEGGGDMQISD